MSCSENDSALNTNTVTIYRKLKEKDTQRINSNNHITKLISPTKSFNYHKRRESSSVSKEKRSNYLGLNKLFDHNKPSSDKSLIDKNMNNIINMNSLGKRYDYKGNEIVKKGNHKVAFSDIVKSQKLADIAYFKHDQVIASENFIEGHKLNKESNSTKTVTAYKKLEENCSCLCNIY